MANLDTALKRFSGHHIMMPWRGIHSLPDGAIGAADRQVLGLMYSGVLAGEPVAPPLPEMPTFGVPRVERRLHRISGLLLGQGSLVIGTITVEPTGQDDIDLTALST